MKFVPHHTAISVIDLDKTMSFYANFGFHQVHRYDDEDKTGVKLKLNTYVLEIFAYKMNGSALPVESSIGNDLDKVGIKHFGFMVQDIDKALESLKQSGLANEETKILAKGTARFFFIRDPNGIWVEVIKDDRN